MWTLATGWLTYPGRVLHNTDAITSGLKILGLWLVPAAVALQLVLPKAWLWRESAATEATDATDADTPPAHHSSGAWKRLRSGRWRATLATLAALMMAMGFTLAAGAVLHHAGWLLRQPQRMEDLSVARTWPPEHLQVAVAFGPWQRALVPPGDHWRSGEYLQSLRRQRGAPPHDMELARALDTWIAVDGVPLDAAAAGLPVMISEFSADGRRILVLRTGPNGADDPPRVAILTAAQWWDNVEQWRPRFAELGIRWPAAFDVVGR